MRRTRVLYTSSPDRGLDILLDLWPRVRERVPEAVLAWAYSPVYFHIAEQDETVGAHAAEIRRLSQQEGVEPLGSLSQPALARLMRESLVWCAPSWNTPSASPFHETFCIGSAEAQAAGCHVVASNWGALAETVKVGHLVDGSTDTGEDGRLRLSERWRAAFVGAIVDGLTDADLQEYAQREGPKAVADMGWDGVGASFAALIEGEVP